MCTVTIIKINITSSIAKTLIGFFMLIYKVTFLKVLVWKDLGKIISNDVNLLYKKNLFDSTVLK